MTDNISAADDSAATLENPTTRRGAHRSEKRGGWIFVRDILIIFVVALLVSFLIKTFLVRSFYIPSGSMKDTLQIDDRILVNELVPNVIKLERGDVVVFRDPGGWLPPAAPKPDPGPLASSAEWVLSLVGLASPDSDDHLIKRVIGLPGDRVECCNALGQMTVNGVPLDEPYVLMPPGKDSVSEIKFSVTVPKDSLWVMGDNRYDSADSRYNQDDPGKGFVPIDDVVGRAFVITWPFDRFGWLGNYPETFHSVPESPSK